MVTKGRRELANNNFFDICSKCKTSCCQNARPPITNQRKNIIESYLKNQGGFDKELFIQAEYRFPKEDREGYCKFYDKKTKECKIHPVKPETCVAGPVTFDINTRKQTIEWYLKREEICPLAGIMNKKSIILERHLNKSKKEIYNLIKQINIEHLREILKIEEPKTFKIDEDKIYKNIFNK